MNICQCHANSTIKLELINYLSAHFCAVLMHLDRDLKSTYLQTFYDHKHYKKNVTLFNKLNYLNSITAVWCNFCILRKMPHMTNMSIN